MAKGAYEGIPAPSFASHNAEASTNTHAHIDHIVGNHYVKVTYSIDSALHQQEVPTLQAAIQYSPYCGFTAYRPIEAAKLLTAGVQYR